MPPPKPSSHSKRPSLSNTMHWLSRSSTQSSSSSPYAPSKPARISEPKLVRSIELLTHPNTGVLGNGAIVVRTPDEALRETGVRLTYNGKTSHAVVMDSAVGSPSAHAPSAEEPLPPLSPPNSPPLPPLPLQLETDQESVYSTEYTESQRCLLPLAHHHHLQLLRTFLTTLSEEALSSHSRTGDIDVVPPLPTNVPHMPPSPPFRLILMSEAPSSFIDPSMVIVTLETSTSTYRTTLETINSRPSHISRYINGLFQRNKCDSVTSSVYSTASANDLEAYRHHLASQGLIPQIPFNLHVFLDRSSAPYVHILNYLRSPIATTEYPEILPRACSYVLLKYSFEALIELRDEAAYLGLEDLHRLCNEEIRLRHGARLHTRGNSNTSTAGSVHSLHASVYSLHTLLERVETDIRSSSHTRVNSVNSRKSGRGSPVNNELSSVPVKSPPTPRSWEYDGHNKCTPLKSPPGGYKILRCAGTS
ncbi:hypothetical protein BDQ17DRAFT_1236649 [Cyathus striatus]|nr:hypothetical protein BDQ17DRAFT_1236649 [Cyathus striatus]